MNKEQLKEKYEQMLNQVETSIPIYETSNNNELRIAAKSLKAEQEELKFILGSIAKATAYDNAQEDIELVTAVKEAFKIKGTELIINLDTCGDTMVGWEKRNFNTQQIIDWHREQKESEK